MRTILVTGADGQIGGALCRTLAPLGRVRAAARADGDLADPDAVRRMVRDAGRELCWIVHAGAYTAVDAAEAHRETAERVNAGAPEVLAEEARRLDVPLLYLSTDYVFDGRSPDPYPEDATPAPLSVYGRTKLEGERRVRAICPRHHVVRLSWVYGLTGRNFLRTMLQLAMEGRAPNVVDDQVGAPTWSDSIAEALAQVGEVVLGAGDVPWGTYHLAAAGRTTWCGFATRIFERAEDVMGPLPRPVAIPSREYPTAATRPANSLLACERIQEAFAIRLGDWRGELDRCMDAWAREAKEAGR